MKQQPALMCAAVMLLLLVGCSRKVTYMEASREGRASSGARMMKNRTFVSSNDVYLDNSLQAPAPQTAQAEMVYADAAEGYEPGIQQAPIQQDAVLSGKPGSGGGGKPSSAVKMKRMVTYDGRIICRSLRPDSLVDMAVALGQSLGGYVESRSTVSVVLRVPVARFGTLYDSLLTLGEVVDFLKTAEDITDAFRDTDLRIGVLEKTIERYVKLVQLVKEEKDKIGLLKEIERLREELEMLRVQKSVLSLRAEYAKLEYSVQQITSGFAAAGLQQQIKGFEWISQLDAFNAYRTGGNYVLPVPEGMVRLDDRDFWIAQSPAGSRVWTALEANVPRGTADFWINAVAFALAGQYPVVDTASASGFRLVHCTPHPGQNYRYSVAVRLVGKKIAVVQLFFPDSVQKERYLAPVLKALSSAGGAS